MMRFILFILITCITSPCFSQQDTTGSKPKDNYLPPCSFPQMPEYAGGYEEMKEFLKTNITYPDSAKAKGIEGTVYIGFYVDLTGEVTDVKLIRGIENCRECNEEVLRVVKMMPKWKPGYTEGKPMKVHYTLPVKFKAPQKKKEE